MVQPSGVRQYITQQFNNVREPLSIVDTITALAPRRGGVQLKSWYAQTCGAVFRHNLSDELLLKYMEIWDYMLSPEGIELSLWGFRDVDYRVEPDGSKTSLLSTAINVKYPSIRLRHWAIWGAYLEFTEGPAFEKPIRDYSNAAQVDGYRAEQNARALGKVNQMATLLRSEERSLFDSSYDPGLAMYEIVSGTGDVRTMYRAMMDDANRRGLQRVIDAKTALLRR